jgi:sugar (pentulose or hexulose) kinase
MSNGDGHLLAIDVGTSETRVSAVSPSGIVVAAAVVAGRARVSGSEAVLDPDELWADLSGLIREVVDGAGQPLALCVASQLGTVLVDEGLTAVGPAFLWQDRRAALEATELAETLDGLDASVAGRPATAELTAACARWVARNRRADWARTRWILSLKDYVVARLTGVPVTDPTSASYTLLYDVHARSWSDDLSAAAGIPVDRLPQVVAGHELGGAVSTKDGARAGLESGVPVAVGGPDGTVGVLGSGAAAPDLTADVAGTTDVLLHTTSMPTPDPSRRSILNAFLLPGLWTSGGPTGMTGGAIAWLCRMLGFASVDSAYRALGPAVARVGPGAGGVLFHTALSGERFPTWIADRTGSVTGLRPDHTPAHLLRSAEEGAAFIVRDGLEALAGLGLQIGEVRISGGAARRPEILQLRADVWKRPVVAVATAEATTVGAGILAAVCAGVHATVADAVASMVEVAPAVDPDPSAADAYDLAYDRWCAERPEAVAA